MKLINECLAAASFLFQSFLYQHFFTLVLGRRYSGKTTTFATLCFAFGATLLRLPPLVSSQFDTSYGKDALIIVLFMGYQIALYQGTLIRYATAWFSFMAGMLMGELVIMKLVYLILGSSYNLDFNSLTLTFGYLIGFVVFLIVTFLVSAGWRWYMNCVENWPVENGKNWAGGGCADREHFWQLLFPLSQFVIFWTMIALVNKRGFVIPAVGMLGMFFGIVADATLFLLFEADDRRRRQQQEIQELNHLYELEQIHYQRLEDSQKKMEKIRHDFKNQLITAIWLAKQEDEKSRASAEEILKELKTAAGK